MKDFILSTEKIITNNRKRIKVRTAGVDLTEFNINPIMLFNHHTDKVIGTWQNIRIKDNKLMAIPHFDEDSESIVIKQKVEGGSLKSASIGIEPIDVFEDEDGILIINESKLLEASIVSIPANSEATILNKNNIIFFNSDKLQMSIDDILKNKKIMTETNLEIQEVIQNSQDVEKIEKIEAQEIETPEPEMTIEEAKALIAELKAKLAMKDKMVTELEARVKELEGELGISNEELQKYKTEKFGNFLENAIKLGKITNESKESFLTLSYDNAEKIINSLPQINASLSDTLKFSRTEPEKTYDWYLKNDKEGLKKMSKENPSLYKQLENNALKTNINK